MQCQLRSKYILQNNICLFFLCILNGLVFLNLSSQYDVRQAWQVTLFLGRADTGHARLHLKISRIGDTCVKNRRRMASLASRSILGRADTRHARLHLKMSRIGDTCVKNRRRIIMIYCHRFSHWVAEVPAPYNQRHMVIVGLLADSSLNCSSV